MAQNNVRNWTSEQVIDWLLNNDLATYLDPFLDAAVDGNKLIQLSKNNLIADYHITDEAYLNKFEQAVKKLVPNNILQPQLYPDVEEIHPNLKVASLPIPEDLNKISCFTKIGMRKFKCGYCKQGTNLCYSAICSRLTVADYEKLKDLGWSRSGTMIYRPILPHNCCPHYQIRVPVQQFKPNQQQKRAWKNMEKFLNGEIEFELPNQQPNQDTSLFGTNLLEPLLSLTNLVNPKPHKPKKSLIASLLQDDKPKQEKQEKKDGSSEKEIAEKKSR